MKYTSGIFFIRDDKALICHPTKHDPNLWSIPKGVPDDGENYWQAAVRETLEETGIEVPVDSIRQTLKKFKYKHGKKTLISFLIIGDENPDINFDIELKCSSYVAPDKGGFPEIDDFRWTTLDDAEKLLHYTQAYHIPIIRSICDEKKTATEEC
jgi:predicted NUDIX family NTP pyrophosphohydrolase